MNYFQMTLSETLTVSGTMGLLTLALSRFIKTFYNIQCSAWKPNWGKKKKKKKEICFS